MSTASSILIPEADIQRRVVELGNQISFDYHGRTITMVGVLSGCFVFMADLIRQIDHAIPVEVEFISVSSYADKTVSSGTATIDRDVRSSINGKDVLLVEGIVDSGLTLKVVLDSLASRSPASIRVATLLDKPARRQHPVRLDYVGFPIPDAFVVGYGLDFAQRYRNLKEIRILDGH